MQSHGTLLQVKCIFPYKALYVQALQGEHYTQQTRQACFSCYSYKKMKNSSEPLLFDNCYFDISYSKSDDVHLYVSFPHDICTYNTYTYIYINQKHKLF